jgi:hypothetical protein
MNFALRVRVRVFGMSIKLKTEVYIGFIPIKIVALLRQNNGLLDIIHTWQQMIGFAAVN